MINMTVACSNPFLGTGNTMYKDEH